MSDHPQRPVDGPMSIWFWAAVGALTATILIMFIISIARQH
jgi:hypothetical protein